MKYYSRTIIALLIGAFISASYADVAYYLKFASDIEGEAISIGPPALGSRLEKSIKVLSLEFEAEKPVNFSSINSGAGLGATSFQALNVIAIMDKKALPNMYSKMFTGSHVDDAEIVAVSSGANGEVVEVFNIKLKLIFFSHVAIEATDSDVAVMNVSLDFGAVQINTFLQDNQGQSIPGESTSWSRVLNNNTFAVQ